MAKVNHRKLVAGVAASLMFSAPSAFSQMLSEEEIENFRSAHNETSSVRNDYIEEIKDAESLSEINDLESEAEDKIKEIIEDNGLTVKRYNEIAVMNHMNR